MKKFSAKPLNHHTTHKQHEAPVIETPEQRALSTLMAKERVDAAIAATCWKCGHIKHDERCARGACYCGKWNNADLTQPQAG